jgi:hypothetical protein
MSHFIIWSNSAMYLGTPNGQASTQFEQPMQRGLSADCTMPPSVCLIASAGHTWAQVGSSQCMHTIGAVWVVRGPVDPFEVDQGLAPVGAALLARLHARLAADAAALVDHEHRRGRRCRSGPLHPTREVEVDGLRWSSVAVGLGDADRGDLELGHLRDRVDAPGWSAGWRPCCPGQWYGMNTVSGRMVVTTWPAT